MGGTSSTRSCRPRGSPAAAISHCNFPQSVVLFVRETDYPPPDGLPAAEAEGSAYMNLFFIAGCAGLAGCLIAIILTLVFHMLGKKKIIPLLLYILSFALFLGGGYLSAHPEAVPELLSFFDRQKDESPEEGPSPDGEDAPAPAEPGQGPENLNDSNAPEDPAEPAEPSGEEPPEGEPSSSAPEEPAPGEGYKITYANAEIYTDSGGTFWCQTLVELENTGTDDLYLSPGSYELKDGGGETAVSRTFVSTYPQVISPGEKAYMYEETTLDGPVEGDPAVIPHPSAGKAAVNKVRFETSGVELSEGRYGTLTASGHVTNNTDKNSEITYIAVILKNDAGEPIGQMAAIIDHLKAGESTAFQAYSLSLPEEVTLDAVAGFTVYAYPMQMQF